MRTAITLVKLHGKEAFKVVSGPEVSIETQKARVKQLACSSVGRTHPEIAEVQLWQSDSGCTKRLRFDKPKPVEKASPKPTEEPTASAPEGETPATPATAPENADAATAEAKQPAPQRPRTPGRNNSTPAQKPK